MKTKKVEKFVTNSHYKNEYVLHMRNLEQVLNYGLISKKVHRVIKFNQNVWLKPYIDTITKVRKITKKKVIKTFSSWRIMKFLEKLENVRKHRNINLVKIERKGNHLISEQNYHIKVFHRKYVCYRNENNSDTNE